MPRNQVCLRKYRQMSQIQLMLWIQVRLRKRRQNPQIEVRLRKCRQNPQIEVHPRKRRQNPYTLCFRERR